MKIDYSALSQSVSQVEIDNYVREHNVNLFLSKKLINTMALIFLVVITANAVIGLALYLIADHKSGALGKFWYFILLIVFYSLALAINKSQTEEVIKNIKLTNFTINNGFHYQPKNIGMKRQGLIFNLGSNRTFKDVISAQVGDKKAEMSNYSFDIKTKDNTVTYTHGYIMIQLNRKLPHMILDTKANNGNFFGINFSNLPISLNSNQKFQLEGDFDKYFTFYAPAGYERDALYIFTPDLMALFIDESYPFDAEIIDDRLFIYSSHRFNMLDVSLLERIFKIINTVGHKTARRSKFYIDERVGDETRDVVALGGSRLKKKAPTVVVLIAILAIIILLASLIVIGLSLTSR